MIGANGYLIGGGVVVLVWLATVLKAILWGAARERAKQDRAQLDAAEEQLEMHRDATAAEQAAAGMTDEEARAEAAKWAKP